MDLEIWISDLDEGLQLLASCIVFGMGHPADTWLDEMGVGLGQVWAWAGACCSLYHLLVYARKTHIDQMPRRD